MNNREGESVVDTNGKFPPPKQATLTRRVPNVRVTQNSTFGRSARTTMSFHHTTRVYVSFLFIFGRYLPLGEFVGKSHSIPLIIRPSDKLSFEYTL